MKAEILSTLAGATLLLSLVLLLILALRNHVRHALGPIAAYRLWLLLPAVMLANVLPEWTPAPDAPLATLATVQVIAAAARAQLPVPAADGQTLLLWVWMIGALLMLLLFCWQQARFVRSLGHLHTLGSGIYRASTRGGAPALIGAVAPRIIVPDGFEQDYTQQQQELILLHERTHLRRGDAQVNALVALLRGVFWFNPLFHYAAVRMRIDQELACDALVLRQRPDARRPYAEAMLSTQLADTGLPVGCQWQSSHPLKERIHMMNQPALGTTRRRLGNLLLAALIGASATIAWASQSNPPAPTLSLDRDAELIDGTPPKYPLSALRDNVTGKVLLQIGIDANGKPVTVNIVQSEPPGVFDAVASAAASAWTFKPAMHDGVAIATQVLMPITFDTHEGAPTSVDAPKMDPLDIMQVLPVNE